MNVIAYIHYVLLHILAALYGHHQVALLAHKKKVSFLGRDLTFKNSEYSILVTWLLFQILFVFILIFIVCLF